MSLSTPAFSVQEALANTHARIATACQLANRKKNDVMLLAVSKTKPLADVMLAYIEGQRHFGENYLQDALDKIDHCPKSDVIWHFIGAIQSNKTKTIAAKFDWVHTLDRSKIALRLNDHRPAHLPPLKVLIQVNISAEENKAGIAVDQLDELVKQVVGLPNLMLCGLMCIPATGQSEAIQRDTFHKMKALRDTLQTTYPHIKELSMGMSGDLALAIACDSSIVRIGTDIFGARTADKA